MAKRNKVEIQEDKEELKDFHIVPGSQAENKISSSKLWPSPLFGLAQTFLRICSVGEQMYGFIFDTDLHSDLLQISHSRSFQISHCVLRVFSFWVISRTILLHGIATAKANYPFMVFVTRKGQCPQPAQFLWSSDLCHKVMYVPGVLTDTSQGDKSQHLGWVLVSCVQGVHCHSCIWGSSMSDARPLVLWGGETVSRSEVVC